MKPFKSVFFAASMVAVALPNAAHAQSAAISYSEILAAPDNLQLNIDYARQEVEGGRLQQAAAALERILLNRPNWDGARLFYGIVLYRLNDLKGAERELAILEGRNLTPEQESDRVRYLALATKRGDPLRISSRISIGARLDSNPGRNVETDVVGAINSTTTSIESDYGATASSLFRLERDFENGRGDFFFFDTNNFINEFGKVNEADLIVSTARAGVQLHGQKFNIAPYITYGSDFLQHKRFRTRYGGGANAVIALGDKVSLLLHGLGVYQDYDTTSFSTIGNRRDGVLAKGKAGLRWRPTDKTTWTLTGSYADKNAKDDGFSYREAGVKLRGLHLLGNGQYVTGFVSYADKDYEQIDNFYSTTEAREDETFKARLAYGLPFSTLFRNAGFELPEALSDVVAQVGVTYTDQKSNIDSVNFDNWSGDVLFTKRFNF